MKVSECRPKAIDHILSKTVLPEEYSKYRKHGDQSLIPKEESLPEIFLKLSNETNFPMEIPDLEEWIETSNELGAIAVGLKVENSKQTTEWGKILNFLQDKPGPRKLKLHPSFFVDAPNIAKNSPEPLRIPVLKDSSNSPLGTALCSYLQNWMRARMVIYSKNTPSDGPPLNLQCSLLTDKPDARWSIVAKLALPLLHASSRAFVIKTRSELDSLKPLSDLRTF